MRILVIGGTRFIGPHVVRRLVDLGHAVTVYHRGQSEAALPEEVRHIRSPEAGMTVLSFSGELLAEHFDTVVHMIPMGEADMRAAM